MKSLLCLFAVLISCTAAPVDIQERDAFWDAFVTAGIEILKDVIKHAVQLVADAEGLSELGTAITAALQLKRDIGEVRSLPLETRQNRDLGTLIQHAVGVVGELMPLLGMESPVSGSDSSQQSSGGLLGGLTDLSSLVSGLFQFGKRLENMDERRQLLKRGELSTEEVRQYNADINQLIQHGLSLWNGLKPYLSNPQVMNSVVSGIDQLLFSANSPLGKRLEKLESMRQTSEAGAGTLNINPGNVIELANNIIKDVAKHVNGVFGDEEGPLGQISNIFSSWFQKRQLLANQLQEAQRLTALAASSA